MDEMIKPTNFNKNLKLKMSNMDMNIKIKYSKQNKKLPLSYWIDKQKIDDYMLPTFTKKVVEYLERE